MALTHVSASQIKDFKACNRLWYYTRIFEAACASDRGAVARDDRPRRRSKRTSKPAPSSLEILERAKALGITEKDLSEYVASMMPFVGKPGEGLTEFRDSMPTFEGGPEYVLVVDHAREIEIKDYGVIPQIDDLKTTSDFRYCKTPDELAKDVQMVSYAKWALWRLYELEEFAAAELRVSPPRLRAHARQAPRDRARRPRHAGRRRGALAGDSRETFATWCRSQS